MVVSLNARLESSEEEEEDRFRPSAPEPTDQEVQNFLLLLLYSRYRS